MRRTKLQSAPEAEAVPIEEPTTTRKNSKPTTKSAVKNTEKPPQEPPVIVEKKTTIEKPTIIAKQPKSIPPQKGNTPPSQKTAEVKKGSVAKTELPTGKKPIVDSAVSTVNNQKTNPPQQKVPVKVPSIVKASLT
ncbi:MAG: hypothetical protein HYZ54_01475, partial [Ignavibacteriae bacterium]|nr:hypothetical protein [Ignavibacteriota bacterium]